MRNDQISPFVATWRIHLSQPPQTEHQNSIILCYWVILQLAH